MKSTNTFCRVTTALPLAIACMIVTLVDIAPAAVVNPVSATASSELIAAFGAANVIAPTDLNGSNEHIGDATFRSWLSSNGAGFVNQEWIFVDLGAEYDLTEIRIWNYHEVAGIETSARGIKDYNLWVGSGSATLPTAGSFSNGSEPTAWDRFSAESGWTNLHMDASFGPADFSAEDLVIGPSSLIGNNTYAVNNVIATNATGVRYIGVDVSAYQYNGSGTSAFFVGLGQIQVVTAEVPSPAALPAGLGLLGLAMARRRRV